MLSAHINQQEQAIQDGIAAAAQAGGDRGQMEHIYELLRTALEGIGIAAPETLGVLSSGYITAFVDAGTQWEYHIQRAGLVLKAVASRLFGIDETLSTVLQEFDYMRRTKPEAARIFGRALCRLHPDTVGLAEEASRD